MKRRKNINREAWTSSIYARTGKAPGARGAGQRLKNAKAEHDALENTCAEVMKREFGIELYKVDAELVVYKDPRTGEKRYKSRVTSGLPDRFFPCPPTGRYVGIEIKINPEDMGRRNQKDVYHDLVTAGGAVFVVHSVDECRQLVRLILAMETEKHQIITHARRSTEVNANAR